MSNPDAGYTAAISARYDEDFRAIFGGDDRGDIAFFCELAAAAGGPVAEVGAGTGRVLIPAAQAAVGQVVVGVEPSAEMRGLAAAKILAAGLDGRVEVVAGHFCEVPLPSASQALVYGAFRSFQHVLTPAAQIASLLELRRVLRPGATLAFDLFDPDYSLLSDAEPACVAQAPLPDGGIVERWDGRRVDRAAQQVEVRFRWIERAADGTVVRDTSDAYRVRYTFPTELAHLVARVGFQDVQIYGDYDRRPVGSEPRELLVIAAAPA